MPFLRLTRDRRGTENTYLMHADRPGDRPRLLYWYRTAPGIALGRLPLDEDAIRLIEEQHPDIDFDWPAILALSEVMTPEDEAPARPAAREQRPAKRRRESAPAGETPRQPRREERTEAPDSVVTPEESQPEIEPEAPADRGETQSWPTSSGLVDQLAGREIASRLRGRYAEITMRIRDAGEGVRERLMKRADALDPDRWDTPEAVLQGVSNADALFETLRGELASSKS